MDMVKKTDMVRHYFSNPIKIFARAVTDYKVYLLYFGNTGATKFSETWYVKSTVP